MKSNSKAMRGTLIVMALLASLALAACGGDDNAAGGGADADVVVNVSLTEFGVEMDTTDIPSGVDVVFMVTNDGTLEHEIKLEAPDAVDEPLAGPDGQPAQVIDIAPGDSGSFTYTFEEGGAFQMACHIAGHYEAGMTQDISVSGA
jgi:uncharacterized cupredoxin-like copper-binding protein